MTDPLSIVLLLIVSGYFILIGAFIIGWLRAPVRQYQAPFPAVRVSVLIPCRNEQENIGDLIKALERQEYPKEFHEVIWIDDHSDDGTRELLESLIAGNPATQLVRLMGPEGGKKAALKAGMQAATGELILLTDADSRPGPFWIRSMAGFFQNTNADLIAGPVVLSPALTWQEKIQKLEFLSLAASSAGAAGLGHPVMIQGPNIGVRASDYKLIVNDLDNRFVSGDDVFLLQSMKRIPGKTIRFNLDHSAIIESRPAGSLFASLRQRQRWASKARGYTDPLMILTTVLVFLSNLSILISILAALFFSGSPILPILLFLLKSLADFPLLLLATGFYQCKPLLIWFLPVQILYPFYIVFAAGWAMMGRVRWK
ncbi:MAG: hypothetical protein A2X22_11870 [Bacteroidetes bacterium GWF2_49_14]|nr:MAG: hypothetical protein A2X22_11870 [Bacteroidetes bacterium GWF2_49_14]